MKPISIVTGIMGAMVVALNGIQPVFQARTMIERRGRVFTSLAIGAAGFVFVMAAIILGAIDLALQYEVQGYIFWESILSVAAGFLITGVVCFLIARWVFPVARPVTVAELSHALGLEPLMHEIRAGLEMAAKATAQPPRPAPPAREDIAHREEVIHHPRGDAGLDQQPGLIH